MLMMIKGEEHIPKEVVTPKALEEQAEMPKEKNPETSMASLKTSEPSAEATDMKSNIRKIILPLMKSANLAPLYSVAVRVHWELDNILEQEHKSRDDIGDIMTLTGEVTRAQALPCGEYMKQSWPRTGTATLAAVRDALLRGYSYHQHQSPTHSIKLDLEGSKATAFETTAIGRPLLLRMNGTPAEIIETIEQFAWLASAFRSVGENGTGMSQVDFRVVSKSSKDQELTTELILLPIRSYVDTEPSSGSRWLSLITSSALAWGFPIQERGQSVGLEIPFQLMLKQFLIRYPLEWENSMVVRQGLGQLTVYPIAKHEDGVQWHAVVGGMNGFFNEIVTMPILSMGKNVTFFSSEHFSRFRTFVD